VEQDSALKLAKELELKLKAETEARLKAEAARDAAVQGTQVSFILDYGYEDSRFSFTTVWERNIFSPAVHSHLGRRESMQVP
jgi:hypothetical protein